MEMVGGRVEGEKYIVTVQRDWNFERLGHLETSGGRAGTLWTWADRLAGRLGYCGIYCGRRRFPAEARLFPSQ